eukprot:TRINITY_DN7775_c0_g3_i4.p1 TRINITY_DN7775_c0_g3~~TRINITY_DN7775_c0_g3_i4.p1  ORF type:complete len:264 (+),score=54.33 TRINITY_DN7775_c0_g3_i4:936-1727(+)
MSKFGYSSHRDAIERLRLKENALNRLNHGVPQGVTRKDVEGRRKREDQEHNVRTFGNTVKGVHGHELPKLAEHPEAKEYWKHRADYSENPKHTSLQEYKQSVKYWAKPDQILLSDTKEFLPNSLRSSFKLPDKKPDYLLKVSEVPYSTLVAANAVMHPLKVPSVFATPKYKSVYEEEPQYSPSSVQHENEPMYSSFSPDHIFKEPYPFLCRSGQVKSLSLSSSRAGLISGHSAKTDLLNRIAAKKSFGAVINVLHPDVRTSAF